MAYCRPLFELLNWPMREYRIVVIILLLLANEWSKTGCQMTCYNVSMKQIYYTEAIAIKFLSITPTDMLKTTTICITLTSEIKIPSSVSSSGFPGYPLTPPEMENPNPSPGLVTRVSSRRPGGGGSWRTRRVNGSGLVFRRRMACSWLAVLTSSSFTWRLGHSQSYLRNLPTLVLYCTESW